VQERAENIPPYHFNRIIRHSGDFVFSVFLQLFLTKKKINKHNIAEQKAKKGLFFR